MRNALGKKALNEEPELGPHDFKDDLERAKETVRRLRVTVEELHQVIRRVEESLQKAKASAGSTDRRPIHDKWLGKTANSAASRLNPKKQRFPRPYPAIVER
jgi:hypothetical protein